jgi:hypothetical protein
MEVTLLTAWIYGCTTRREIESFTRTGTHSLLVLGSNVMVFDAIAVSINGSDV